MSVPRSKTYRSVSAKALKTGPLKVSGSLSAPPAYSSGLAASDTHLAVCVGASKGSVALLPVDSAGYTPAASPFTISAHASDIGDLAFAPHAPHLLASCGALDGVVKLWQLPSDGGLKANLTTPTTKFEGLDAAHALAWHPSAGGVLAAGGKAGVSVFDAQAGAELRAYKNEGVGKDVTSLHWSRTGALLAAVSKNAALSVFDPRSADASCLSSSAPSSLIKKLQHGVFIGGEGSGNPEFLLLFGVSAAQRPVMQWVDPRNPSAAVKTHDFDFSQGYALPQYDADTGCLFYTIRGSELISILDVENDTKGAPSVWPSHQFGASSAVKGLALLPKRAVATNSCEVARVFALGAEAVEVFSATVARKTAGFHAELFPDTADVRPAMSAEEWAGGKDAAPLKTSMVAIHHAGGATAAAASAAALAGLKVSAASSPTAAAAAAASPSAASSSASSSSASGQRGSVSAAPATRGASGSVVSPSNRGSISSPTAAYVASDVRSKIDQSLKKSIFAHNQGKEPPTKFATYFDLALGPTLALAENIQANSKFFAVPWKASGGSALAVFRLAPDALGRCPPTQFCVRGHKSPATTFDLSPFRLTQLATGAAEGQVFVWSLPEGGLTADLHTPSAVLQAGGQVRLVKYHPLVSDLLLAASSGFDGHLLEAWDVSAAEGDKPAQPALSITAFPDAIIDFAVHPAGHLVAVSCRDGKTRVVHLQQKKVLAEWSTPEGVKDTRVVWTGAERLLTVGFGAAGQKSLSLWNTRASPPALLQTFELDRTPYLPLPRFDLDTGLLYLANAGGTFVPLFKISGEEKPHIEQINMFQTSVDTVGWCLLPKHAVDVRKVELARVLQLTKDAVLPISYTVPRKRTEFFQDDLYPQTRAAEASLTAKAFLGGQGAEGIAPKFVSLQPGGMAPLSEAPDEEATSRQLAYAARLAESDKPKLVGALGAGISTQDEVKSHFVSLVKDGALSGNRWDARQDNSKVDVDESEWD